MLTATPNNQSLIRASPLPGRRTGSLLLVALSLSVGWGIRGNFGHEYGAAFAGCLAAITGSLVSGRTDWRARVLYFAFFGALGWGFGGSISYMQMISATESGHAPSQWYGYTALFYIGFLWAALGGAGTALAAVAQKDRLDELFRPLLFVFGSWILLDLLENPLAGLLQSGLAFDHTWSRHKSPLYWFDADYLAAFSALAGLSLYDVLERKERNTRLLAVFAGGGALTGWLIQAALRLTGLDRPLADSLTYSLGDPGYRDPATGALAFEADNFLNNWPQWFGDYPAHIGWFVGLLLGITAYFVRYGQFRNGASLFVYMAAGWIIGFLLFPVLGSLLFADYGGLRMTPPRSDDWAGITGVFAGMLLWMRRNGYRSVMTASVVAGTIGGLGFSGIQWVKQLLMAPGNPRITGDGSADEALIASWADWQQQNWHSFLEQSYGFVNGLAVAVVLNLLVSRIPTHADKPEAAGRKWPLGFTAFFVLLAIPYVNLVKNVNEWGSRLNPDVWQRVVPAADGSQESAPARWDMPFLGRLPGIDFLHLTPTGWYNLSWMLLAVAFVLLVRRHFREPLALVPGSWLGKGQLLFLILLWTMVIGNFERALVGWTPQRLLTEWVIFVNAVLATWLVLILPGEKDQVVSQTDGSFSPLYQRAWRAAGLSILLAGGLFLLSNRLIYRYPSYEKLDKSRYFTRFGPEAAWRAKPNLKNARHK